MASPNAETRFTADHEWVRLEDGVATVGITDHAQGALGDIVFVELPEAGRMVDAQEACAVVESVKAASDVFAPLAGRVATTNEAVVGDPSLLNRAPAGEGWLFRLEGVEPEAFAGLMDASAYQALVDSL